MTHVTQLYPAQIKMFHSTASSGSSVELQQQQHHNSSVVTVACDGRDFYFIVTLCCPGISCYWTVGQVTREPVSSGVVTQRSHDTLYAVFNVMLLVCKSN